MPPLPALKPTTSRHSHAARRQARPTGAAAHAVLALLRGYKLILSPFCGGGCRFQPSCSDYMAEAVRVHGAGRGVWLGLRRLARCRPAGGYGVDPVPGP